MRSLTELDPAQLMASVKQGRAAGRGRRLLYIALGIGIGLGLAINDVDLPGITPSSLLAAPLGYYLGVALHELAHAIVAKSQRFRLSVFAIGAFRIERQTSGWRVVRGRMRGVAGFVAVRPVGAERLKERFMAVVAAGPLASLLVAAVCISTAVLGSQSEFWRALLWVTGGMSVMAIVPRSTRVVIDDWHRLLSLRRGKPEADRAVALLLLAGAAREGVRPRDQPNSQIEALGPRSTSVDGIAASAIRYSWLLDSGRIDEAEDELVWVMEHCFSPEQLMQAAFFLAYFRKDAAASRRWLDAAPASVPAEFRYIRMLAEAAIAYLEQRHEAMNEAIDLAQRECSAMADRGTAIPIREAMLDLRNRAAIQ